MTRLTFTNGFLTDASIGDLSNPAPKKYSFINGLCVGVSDATGLSKTQGIFKFVNGILVSTGSFTSGSVTPPPPSSNIWVAGGLIIGDNHRLAYSYDGLNWTHLTSVYFTSGGICTNGNMFVAVGQGYNTEVFAYSTDGLNWTKVSNNNTPQCVAWNGTRFVAAGLGEYAHPDRCVFDSTDGVNWHVQNSHLIGNISTIAWNGNMFVIGGSLPDSSFGTTINTMAYSSDGLGWTGLGKTIFTTNCSGVATNGFVWVAVGNGTNSIAYSTDGTNWTGLGTSIFTGNGQSICWNGTMFVAGGTGTNKFAYSYDGINWTGLGNPLSYDIGTPQSIATCIWWDGSKFIAGSDNLAFPYLSENTLGYSIDGINWTGLGTGFFPAWNSIVSNHAPALIPPV